MHEIHPIVIIYSLSRNEDVTFFYQIGPSMALTQHRKPLKVGFREKVNGESFLSDSKIQNSIASGEQTIKC